MQVHLQKIYVQWMLLTLILDMWQKLYPVCLLVCAMFFLQLGAALAKQLFPLVGSVGTTALRLFFSSLCLCLFFRPWKLLQDKQAWLGLLLFGMSLGVMNLFFYLAIERIPLGIAVALEFLGPLTVALIFSRQILDVLWIIFAAIGIYMISPFHTATPTTLDPLGVVYVLIAAVAWGAYILIGQRVSRQHGTASVSIAVSVAACMVLPMGVYSQGLALLSVPVLLLGFAVAILSSAIPYGLEAYVLRKLDARTFGTLLCFEPVCASLMGMIFLHEFLEPTQWIAIGFILLASVGATFFQRRR